MSRREVGSGVHEELHHPHRPEVSAEDESAPATLDVQVKLKARSRVRQALVCPYCRDDSGRLDVVACGGSSCGALYHQACWDECLAEYGACAVFGCEARESKLVSYWGYMIRLLRLLVAAVLFPPRVVKAIRDHEGEGFRDIYRHALVKAKRIYRSSNQDSNRQALLVMVLGIPLSYLIAFGLVKLRGGISARTTCRGSWGSFSAFRSSC